MFRPRRKLLVKDVNRWTHLLEFVAIKQRLKLNDPQTGRVHETLIYTEPRYNRYLPRADAVHADLILRMADHGGAG